MNKSKYIDELKERLRQQKDDYSELEKTSQKEQRKLEMQLEHLNE